MAEGTPDESGSRPDRDPELDPDSVAKEIVDLVWNMSDDELADLANRGAVIGWDRYGLVDGVIRDPSADESIQDMSFEINLETGEYEFEHIPEEDQSTTLGEKIGDAVDILRGMIAGAPRDPARIEPEPMNPSQIRTLLEYLSTKK